MKEKFNKFMQGRYGHDEFSAFIFSVALIGLILAILTHRDIFFLIGAGGIVYGYVRVLSKNHVSRMEENQKYLKTTSQIRNKIQQMKNQFQNNIHSDYKIYTCPTCGQKIRVPKGKGKIEITCPRCKTKFVKRT